MSQMSRIPDGRAFELRADGRRRMLLSHDSRRPPAARTNSEQEHLEWVDRAKGVGIILVVFGHVADGVYRAGVPFAPAAFRRLYEAIYSFHMPLFFLLAGLFLYGSWAHRGSAELIRSKVRTILYPYILWSLLQGSIEVTASQYTNQHTSMTSVLALLWMPRQQFWFLYVLFVEFVLGAAVCALIPRRWNLGMVILAAAVFVFRSSGPHTGPIYYLAAESVFFLAGLALRDRLLARYQTSAAAFMLSLAGFVASQLALTYYRDELPEPFRGALELAIASFSIAFVICLSRLPSFPVGRWLAVLGQQSLAIYLMHTLFASGARIVLLRLLGVNRLDVHLIAGTVLGLAVPLMCAGLVQHFRIPGVFSMPSRRRPAAKPHDAAQTAS